MANRFSPGCCCGCHETQLTSGSRINGDDAPGHGTKWTVIEPPDDSDWDAFDEAIVCHDGQASGGMVAWTQQDRTGDPALALHAKSLPESDIVTLQVSMHPFYTESGMRVGDTLSLGDLVFLADDLGDGWELRVTNEVITETFSLGTWYPSVVEQTIRIKEPEGTVHTFVHAVGPGIDNESLGVNYVNIELRGDNLSVWIGQAYTLQSTVFYSPTTPAAKTREYLALNIESLTEAQLPGRRWGVKQYDSAVAHYQQDFISAAKIIKAIADNANDGKTTPTSDYCDPCFKTFFPGTLKDRIKVTLSDFPTTGYTASGQTFAFPSDLNGEYVFQSPFHGSESDENGPPCGMNSILGTIGTWTQNGSDREFTLLAFERWYSQSGGSLSLKNVVHRCFYRDVDDGAVKNDVPFELWSLKASWVEDDDGEWSSTGASGPPYFSDPANYASFVVEMIE